MPIPDYQTLMLPLLQYASDGSIHAVGDAVEHLSNSYNLSVEEREVLLPSRQTTTIYSRVGWARSYLKMAGLLIAPKRSYFQITEEGQKVLAEKPPKITKEFLMKYESFRGFVTKRNSPKGAEVDARKATEFQIEQSDATPTETMELSYQELRKNLSEELLEVLKTVSPAYFERIVVELLVCMGYGGSFREAAEVVGKSGDGGIDGIIKEDKLGLDTIYIQARRWVDAVGRPEIQKFAGALLGKKAKKGIFVTTSSFGPGAMEYVQHLPEKIILINGSQLTEYMMEYDVGVSITDTYHIKRLDADYFNG